MSSTLPPAAEPVWEAYLAMDGSKRAHFELLAALEKKYERGGRRTAAETARLESLLAEHDTNVKRFKQLSGNLAREDLAAHQSLIEHITLFNTALGEQQT